MKPIYPNDFVVTSAVRCDDTDVNELIKIAYEHLLTKGNKYSDTHVSTGDVLVYAQRDGKEFWYDIYRRERDYTNYKEDENEP